MRTAILVAAAVAAPVGGGCGKGNGKQSVAGTVSYQSKPLDGGTIRFVPTGGPPAEPGGAPVQDGRFSIPAVQGLEPGSYRVEISAPVPGGELTAEEKANGGSPRAKESLPPKYNRESKLTAEVKAGEKNELTFTLD